jgi:hypothetical protein
VDAMNAPLRNTIWNFVVSLMPPPSMPSFSSAIVQITGDVLRLPTQRIPFEGIDWVLEQVEKLPWDRVYDLLEYAVAMANTWKQLPIQETLAQANVLLAREHSGYRFVAGQLSPIIDSAEIEEIERATHRTSKTGLEGVREHLTNALTLFGKRPKADYRNAIKEAISAVEGLVKLVGGSRSGGLHAALEAGSSKLKMHPALKSALEKLYAYASDAEGVRHAIVEESTVDETEARFMIITCSAIVNLLIVRADEAGVLPQLK